MTWYVVNLYFESSNASHAASENLWEESMRLIEAESPDAALDTARAKATQENHSFRNESGELVEWQFRRAERACEIEAETFINGIEIFSRFLSAAEATSLLSKITAA